VICIRHLNKGGSQNPKYRGGGSIGIIGAARAAFLFGEAPGRDHVHVMAPVKGNLWRAKPPALEYVIEERSDQPVIVWHGESQCNAKSLLAQPESTEESNGCAGARGFLLEMLAAEPVDAKEVKREARNAGIAEKTLYRAKDQLGVLSQKKGFGEGQHWAWALPNMVNPRNLTTFEESNETKRVNSTNSLKMAKNENTTTFGSEDGHLHAGTESSPQGSDAGEEDGEITL